MTTFKLAIKNMMSKPLRTVATVIAIALSVAMIFVMLSFKSVVYDYIYATDTAASGSSDILVSTNPQSSRITDAAALYGVEGVDYVCPTLSLYATYSDEYVKIRGFQSGHITDLQSIKLSKGSYSNLNGGQPDYVVISENAAKHFGVGVGSQLELTLGSNKVKFYVEGIAKSEGYFLQDAPYLIVGNMLQVSQLVIAGAQFPACNEIYVKAKAGVDVDALTSQIAAMPEYSDMLVQRTGDSGYISEQANSLSAPIILAGAAVFALGIAVIVLLFMMSGKQKVQLISKYSVIGATKSQIFSIFMTESVLVAFMGALVGSFLAVGIFVALVKITLSSAAIFGISALALFGAAAIGFVTAIASSAYPVLKSFRGTIRQNQTGSAKRSKVLAILCPVLILLTVICVIIEFALPKATAIVSVFSLVFALLSLGVSIGLALKGGAHLIGKSQNPVAKVASVGLKRESRFARSVTMLGVGMTVSMLLFMSFAMTKSAFNDYVSNFDDMVFVTNIRANADISEFESVEGVSHATKIVWRQGGLKGRGFDKTMNILGTKDALGIVDFKYHTIRDEVESLLAQGVDENGKPYVFLDVALKELYGVKVGDILDLDFDGNVKQVVVGGILEHNFFSGNYVVISDDAILSSYGISVDTILITADGNMNDVVGALREKFANKNNYVVDVLTAYKWDMQSTDAVFNLIGTIACVVSVFIFVVTVAATMVGRTAAQKDRTALLNAGMSKQSLLASEVLEHAMIALTSFVLSVGISALLTACLIHALRLFGLYFTFMYKAWVVIVVGAIMAIGYILLPVAFNFKKGYNIKKG